MSEASTGDPIAELEVFFSVVLPDRVTGESYRAQLLPPKEFDRIDFLQRSELAEYLVQEGERRNAYFAVGSFEEGSGDRKEGHLRAFQCAWVDLDCGEGKAYPGKEAAMAALDGFELPASAIVDSGHGLHAYWRFKDPVRESDFPAHRRVLEGLVERLNGDPGARSRTQILRPPGTWNLDSRAKRKDGLDHPVRLLRLNQLHDGYSLSDFPVATREISRPGPSQRFELPRHIPEGARHLTMVSLAAKARGLGMNRDEVNATLGTVNQTRTDAPLPDEEIESVADWASGLPRGSVDALLRTPDAIGILPRAPFVTGHRLTDLGNSERLIDLFGADLRYVQGSGWRAWDGKRWAPGDVVAERAAKYTVRSIYLEIADCSQQIAICEAEKRPALEERLKELPKHAKHSERAFSVANLLKLAQSDIRINTRSDALDAEPMLLTCENGTLDLRTGELQPHAREDLITRLAPVAYDPEARSDIWEAFLQDVTGGDDALIGFLQRVCGYALSGDTREEKLFVITGPAASGKSTFIETLKSVLGDYAATADFDSFLKRRANGGVRNDIARLAGARLVSASEGEDGKALATSLLKQMTGRDTVTARFLFGEHFEFRPQFKLFLVANHLPTVHEHDDGIWRRIEHIPFAHQVAAERRDTSLKPRLTNPGLEGAGVLAWAVRGCLEWQRLGGLATPESVRRSTGEYREEMDLVGLFIEECCDRDPDAVEDAAYLYGKFKAWLVSVNEEPMSQQRFGSRLHAEGFASVRTQSRRRWRGIGLHGWEGRVESTPIA